MSIKETAETVTATTKDSWTISLYNERENCFIKVNTSVPWRLDQAKVALYEGAPPPNDPEYAENISIAHDRNNTKESCMKSPLSLVNGDELAVQSRSAGTGKKTGEEIDAETAGGTRGYPVFMAVAE